MGDCPCPPAPVSVVIPAYRAASTIRRALESAANQTLPAAEIIIVDDGSDDGTVDAVSACRDLLSKWHGPANFILLRQTNAGAGAARNRAVAHSSQPLIAFLDADDEWLPEHLEKSVAVMTSGSYVLTAHNEWIVDDGVESLNDCAARFRMREDPVVGLYERGYISTSTVLVRRDAIIAAGGFDETLANGQDADLWTAILLSPAATFRVFETPLSRYYITPTGINAQTSRRLACYARIAERWARDIVRRPHGGLRALWFRALAIHYTAMRAHAAKREWLRALCSLARLPDRLLRLHIVGMLGRPHVRAPFAMSESSGHHAERF